MEAVFLKLLNMSIAASWLILAVLLLRLVFKGAPKSFRVALWGLAGLRLALPVSLESALSLVPSAETVSPNILYSETPAISTGIAAVNAAVNPAISQALAPQAGASVNPMQVLAWAAALVWMIGMAALFLYAAVSYLLLRRRVAESVPLRDKLRQSAKIASPFVLGLFRPRVYLPFGLDEAGIALIAAHENAHIQRRDHWIKPLGFLLLIVHWFNPLVWLGYVLLCRDVELACDERVVRDLDPEARKAYSRALLDCGAGRFRLAACPLAFGEAGVRQRIKNVLNYKKPAFWLILPALAACAAVALCFLTNPKTAGGPSLPADAQGAGAARETEAVSGEAEAYVFEKCLYSNPLSSAYPFDGTGERYLIGGGRFSFVSEETGAVLSTWELPEDGWQTFTDEDWEALFTIGGTALSLAAMDADQRRVQAVNRTYRLFDMDGEYWLVQMHGEYAWAVYVLAPAEALSMTLSDVLALAAKGDGLTWDDLAAFPYTDVGSGRYIYEFPIGDSWRLVVNSGSGFRSGETVSDPAALECTPDGESVDIRAEGLGAARFIAEKYSAETGYAVVCSGYGLCCAVYPIARDF